METAIYVLKHIIIVDFHQSMNDSHTSLLQVVKI